MKSCNKKCIRLFLISLICITAILCFLSYQYLDKYISNFIYMHDIYKTPGLAYFTMLGKNVVVFSLVLLVIFYYRFIKKSKKNEIQAWYVFSCVLLANLISFFFKISFGRARPMQWIENEFYGFYGPNFQSEFWSFPSGHTVSVMSLAFALCFLTSNYFYRVLFILAALTLLASRIFLLQHYLSDTVAATLIGYIIAFILYRSYFRSKIYSH